MRLSMRKRLILSVGIGLTCGFGMGLTDISRAAAAETTKNDEVYFVSGASPKSEENDTVIRNTSDSRHGVDVAGDGEITFQKGLDISTAGSDANGIHNEGTIHVLGKTKILTSHRLTTGLHNSGTATFSDLSIETKADNSTAIENGGGSTLTVDGAAHLKTDGRLSSAIQNLGTLTFKKMAAIETMKPSSYGISNSSAFTAETGLQVTTHGKDAIGIENDGFGTLTIQGDTRVETDDVGAKGISNKGKANLENTTVLTKEKQANAVENTKNIVFTKDLTSETQGNEAHGVYTSGDQSLTVHGATRITTKGEGSYGFYHQGGTSTFDGSLHIETSGTKSMGLSVEFGKVTTKGDVSVTTHADAAIGINTQGPTVSLTMQGPVKVKTAGNQAVGFNIVSPGFTAEGAVSVEATGDGGAAISHANSDGGTAVFKNALTVDAGKNSLALTNLKGDLSVDAGGNGAVKIRGDIVSVNAAKTQLTLRGQDAYLAGAVLTDYPITPGTTKGSVDLTLADGATWYVPETYVMMENDPVTLLPTAKRVDYKEMTLAEAGSQGASLRVQNGSIDFAHYMDGIDSIKTYKETRTFTFKQAGSHLNGANFVLGLKADGGVLKSDQIKVEDIKSANTYTVQLAPKSDDTIEAMKVEKIDLPLIETTGDSVDVQGKSYKTSVDTASGLLSKTYEIVPTLKTESGKTRLVNTLIKDGNTGAVIYDPNASTPPNPIDPSKPSPTPDPIDPSKPAPEPAPGDTDGPVTRAAIASTGSVQAGFTSFRTADNDLYRRMGDLRQGISPEGAWVRSYGGKLATQTVLAGRKDIRYHGFQVGYDRSVDYQDGRLYLGVTASTTHGSMQEGSVKSHLFGLYSSYIGKRGHFLDAIVKYGRMMYDGQAMVGGRTVSYDVGAPACNISAEYGRRNALEGGLYWEPQAELNYSRMAGHNYASGAARVHVDAISSFSGRLGVNLGKEMRHGNVYLSLSYNHDFKSRASLMASDGVTTLTRSQDFKRNYWSYGVGFNQKIGEHQNVYGDLTFSSGGGAIKEKYRWNIGYRVNF